MAEGPAPPQPREPQGDHGLHRSTASAPTEPSGRERNDPISSNPESSLPAVTIRSEDVETESGAARQLRHSLRPSPYPPPGFDLEPNRTGFVGSDSRGGVSANHDDVRRDYPQSIPPKGAASHEIASVQGGHHHHHHHHYHDIPRPSDSRRSDPQASVKTAPAVPLALRAKPKPYQWFIAAIAGALIAIVLAFVHTRAARPTTLPQASSSTLTNQSPPQKNPPLAPTPAPEKAQR